MFILPSRRYIREHHAGIWSSDVARAFGGFLKACKTAEIEAEEKANAPKGRFMNKKISIGGAGRDGMSHWEGFPATAGWELTIKVDGEGNITGNCANADGRGDDKGEYSEYYTCIALCRAVLGYDLQNLARLFRSSSLPRCQLRVRSLHKEVYPPSHPSSRLLLEAPPLTSPHSHPHANTRSHTSTHIPTHLHAHTHDAYAHHVHRVQWSMDSRGSGGGNHA